ncbi:hypothetical protein Mal48_40270 [Thalassoglobus polymorphus]|uniref:Uncharacterized protein n=1 Tax=Thalassoglobus polymorphus TaxID=2527994 RepID=A0A517QSY6_9PLAN|nr:hypothetical protein Mal48_40270 [Thalassoglobus polymorphus]
MTSLSVCHEAGSGISVGAPESIFNTFVPVKFTFMTSLSVCHEAGSGTSVGAPESIFNTFVPVKFKFTTSLSVCYEAGFETSVRAPESVFNTFSTREVRVHDFIPGCHEGERDYEFIHCSLGKCLQGLHHVGGEVIERCKLEISDGKMFLFGERRFRDNDCFHLCRFC